MTHKNRSISQQLRGLLRLTRWREYVPFVIPLTILGALLAARPNDILLDWRLLTVMGANILAVAYAFMINDIENAPEDALNPERASRNPIALGMVNIRTGYAATRIVAAATLILYATAGLSVFLIGLLTIFIAHMYSWRPVRLKALPVTDVVSHSLMLSGTLLLAGYFIYHDDPGVVWFVAIGATLLSIYGQLYRQLENYDVAKHAGLKNTAIWLGEEAARRIMQVAGALAIASLAVAIFEDVFPIAFLVAIPAAFMLRALLKSASTYASDDFSDTQRQTRRLSSLLILNLIIAAWLVYAIGDQIQILTQMGFQ